MDIDEQEELPKKRGRKNGTTPAKHGAPERRLPLENTENNPSAKAPAESPAKIPQTPRHRDAASSKVAVTPRHRLIIAGRPLTPRSPHTPSTPRNSVPTVYNEGRQLFSRGNAPSVLYGREKERTELESFISARTKTKRSGCIYVSGPPGTGKSAFVNDVTSGFASETVKMAYINCMSMKNAADLFRTLLEEFVDISNIAEGDEMETLKKIFFSRKTSYIITLDEVDHLLELDIELLYNIFEWSLQKTSSLVLVGIANALDFTDRFLPRLKSRGLKPHLLPFLPYTASQISAVITSKLKALLPADSNNTVPFIHPTAIMFLSKKVAAQSGDLRKALDICRRAIDLIEAETRDKHAKMVTEITPAPTPSPSKNALFENMNLASPAIRSPMKSKTQTALASSLAQLTVADAPRATIAHMARITATIFSNGTTQRLQSLNLQQKAVLCALSALEKKKRASSSSSFSISSSFPSTPSKKDTTAPSIKELYEMYTAMCKRENVLHPLTSTEFRDIVGSLETLSLVSAVEGKAGSLVTATTPSRKGRGTGGFGGAKVEERRVASVISSKELAASLSGPGSGILKGILEGEEF